MSRQLKVEIISFPCDFDLFQRAPHGQLPRPATGVRPSARSFTVMSAATTRKRWVNRPLDSSANCWGRPQDA